MQIMTSAAISGEGVLGLDWEMDTGSRRKTRQSKKLESFTVSVEQWMTPGRRCEAPAARFQHLQAAHVLELGRSMSSKVPVAWIGHSRPRWQRT
ncbi:MAG: hypothetical protein BGO16_11730 [Nitrobacter sp. 62-23]|nr:MAG: hypothetical protein BGO16_11730 [Nitrobacter sp. 62-23]